MKTLLLLISLLFTLSAQESIHFKQGWQLSGVATQLNVEDLFNNDNIELIWAYNASTQKWEGYSPNSSTQAKIEEHSFGALQSIAPSQGFWIKSREGWSLNLDGSTSLENSNNLIELKSGWNLISLGAKASISPTLFGDDIVWKYSDSWEFFSTSNDLDFPTIDALVMGEGFWVKTENPRKINLDKALSELHTFNSIDGVKEYIRDMKDQNDHYYYAYGYPLIYAVNDLIYAEVADDTMNSATDTTQKTAASDTTDTNLQEEGVDESDILKHTNTHLFFYNSSTNKINITTYSNLVNKTASNITPISLESNSHLEAMYLQNSHLIVILQHYYYDYIYDYEVVDGMKQEPTYHTPAFSVVNYDVSDINNIKKVKSVAIDGYFSESRITNGKLYVISQFYPKITYEYEKVAVECSESSYYKTNMDDSIAAVSDIEEVNECIKDSFFKTPFIGSTLAQPFLQKSKNSIQREERTFSIILDSDQIYPCYYYAQDSSDDYYTYDYSKATIVSEDLLPKVDQKEELITPSKFYAPYKLSQTPNITSITTFDITTDDLIDSISYMGNSSTIYMTPSSLYISSREYPIYYSYNSYVEQETIYHFAIEPLEFISKGSVRGHFLSSYSLSEYNSTLRVATTEGGWWRGDTINSIFTFKDEGSSLKQVGKLTGLGEEAERITAARFYGDRGFLVTFRQTDPLYTIDLSDATDPKKVGELHVNGFSEYLHLVDENTLLSFGRDANSMGNQLGLQIQLFDISDFANPSLLDKVSVGDNYTYSELSYNPSMFIYRSSDKKFAIPYKSYNCYEQNYMGVFDLNNSKINEYFTLQVDSHYYSSLRGVIYDYNNSSYATMFATDKTLTKAILKP